MVEKIVYDIADYFKQNMGDSLVSVIVHGSFAQDSAHKSSDIDYFFVLKYINYVLLNKIRELKIDAEKIFKRELSINIQKLSEMPSKRGKAFYHKNRYALFLYETNKIDKVIIGKNPYLTESMPSDEEIKLEAVRIINSFSYFLRKYIVNSDIDFCIKEAIRYVIMSTQYANAFRGIYPTKTKESVKIFSEKFSDFKMKNLPIELFELKVKRINADKDKILKESVEFLESLDEYLFEKYSNL